MDEQRYSAPAQRQIYRTSSQSLAKNILTPIFKEDDFVDLGDVVDKSLAGIFSPRADIWTKPIGVTAQFLENPEDFHHAEPDTSHAEWLVKSAIEKIAPLPPTPTVLDVGSGSGNTAFAMLKSLGEPIIIASDISRPLLRTLVSTAKNMQRGEAVVPVCLDLNRPWFEDGRFDLIVGRAILHHLFDPSILIDNLYKSLKPGASMMFFEPYECGYAIFGMLIEIIIAKSYTNPGISDNILQFLKNTTAEYQNCTPKPIEIYADIDDKWNFTKIYFERIADQIGAQVRVYPLYESSTPYSGELIFRLKAGIGADKDALPPWAWEIIERWEARLSQDALDELGCAVNVVFTKSLR